MRTTVLRTAASAICLVALLSAGARAEEKVTLSGVHVCCKGCSMAIEQAAAKVAGVTCVASKDDSNAVLTADSKDKIQEAVNEIAKAGLIGTPDDAEIKVTPAKTADGKVQKLEITHIHNCCGGCTDAIKAALDGVEGVTSNTCEPKKTSFTVEGDFVAADVVKALIDAGFYGETE